MNLEQLKERVSVQWCGYGAYRVTITWRGQEYSTTSNNSLAYDRIKGSDDWGSDREVHCFYTLKQAYEAFYEEVKRRNSLPPYDCYY